MKLNKIEIKFKINNSPHFFFYLKIFYFDFLLICTYFLFLFFSSLLYFVHFRPPNTMHFNLIFTHTREKEREKPMFLMPKLFYLNIFLLLLLFKHSTSFVRLNNHPTKECHASVTIRTRMCVCEYIAWVQCSVCVCFVIMSVYTQSSNSKQWINL